MGTSAADARAKINHPLIDGDSHIIEYTPVLMDFVRAAGGEDFARVMEKGRNVAGWYSMTDEQRRQGRTMRGPWWALPTQNTTDRVTAMLPQLYYERMDDFGLDFMVLYPTQGLFYIGAENTEYRQVVCHAYNEYIADCYGQYSDRMTPAAIIPLHTPDEGIRELEHAHSLGLKVAMIPSYIRRPVPKTAESHPDIAHKVTWLDSYGIDSAYDYDPFWAKCVELGFPVAAHSGGMGFDDRRSISNYMYNHMGHFAAGGEVLAKSLLMGGVTARFPDLRVALLEGGVQNGVRLYADIFSRWSKRRPDRLERLDPTNLDMALANQLFEQYGDAATQAKIAGLEATLKVGPQEIDPLLKNDFRAMEVETKEDIRDRFIPNFYFGCESDDPLACIAFDRKINPLGEQVRAIMSFDLGHWDVTNMDHAAAEAYEQVEMGLFNDADFKKFGFENSVHLYGDTNPDFFKGTRIETETAEILAGA
ncbi:MAG: amidohydrolase [Alphaproteobacteria bacterium]|nr:MAG: amidohydrolase [Alphaproteobacteria bacterium]